MTSALTGTANPNAPKQDDETKLTRVDFEGRGVTYRSVVEMQAALTTINKEIEQAGGGATSPRRIVITPKGI